MNPFPFLRCGRALCKAGFDLDLSETGVGDMRWNWEVQREGVCLDCACEERLKGSSLRDMRWSSGMADSDGVALAQFGTLHCGVRAPQLFCCGATVPEPWTVPISAVDPQIAFFCSSDVTRYQGPVRDFRQHTRPEGGAG